MQKLYKNTTYESTCWLIVEKLGILLEMKEKANEKNNKNKI